MREKEITTGKGKFLLKEMLPEVVEFDAKRIVINGKAYRSVGKVVTLTEEDWRDVVDFRCTFLSRKVLDTIQGFHDYVKDESYAYPTAVESGLSLLKANGVVLENWIKKPRKMDYASWSATYKKDLEKWQEAQQQVWSNVYLFAEL